MGGVIAPEQCGQRLHSRLGSFFVFIEVRIGLFRGCVAVIFLNYITRMYVAGGGGGVS